MEIHMNRVVSPKEKRPPGRTPKYTVEYYMMVARKVVEEGMSYSQASKEFNLSQGCIGTWIKKYKNGTINAKRNERNKKFTEGYEQLRQEAHVKELKLQIADLYLENLMLKKALQHSLQIKKESSSVITSESSAPSARDAE